jgi:hypothetical protein
MLFPIKVGKRAKENKDKKQPEAFFYAFRLFLYKLCVKTTFFLTTSNFHAPHQNQDKKNGANDRIRRLRATALIVRIASATANEKSGEQAM